MSWSILSLTKFIPIQKSSSPNKPSNTSIKFSISTKPKPIMSFKWKMPNSNLPLFSNTGAQTFISITFTYSFKSGKLPINKPSSKTSSTLTLINSPSTTSANFTSSSKKPPIKTQSIKITLSSSTSPFIMPKNSYNIKIILKLHPYWLTSKTKTQFKSVTVLSPKLSSNLSFRNIPPYKR